MGEYAIYVWPCYIATVVLLTGLCYSSWVSRKRAERKLAELKEQLDNQEE